MHFLAVLTQRRLLRCINSVCHYIIWIAHIGLDRTLGYSLKYSTDFRSTHLGAIGREVKNLSSGRPHDVG
ncbi:DUF4260 family protein [Rouxiella sp. Mn2063]|uniref:DUF4260 family protein n=1 Tax=Rouxiella sp. Mn2063 TaxID=3395262 RepID=UPI003BE735B8